MNRYADIKKIKNTNEFVGTLGTQYYKDVTYLDRDWETLLSPSPPDSALG